LFHHHASGSERLWRQEKGELQAYIVYISYAVFVGTSDSSFMPLYLEDEALLESGGGGKFVGSPNSQSSPSSTLWGGSMFNFIIGKQGSPK
jgi:hypothetical protein